MPEALSGVTIILPVVTETASLDETVRVLHATCDASIDEVLVVVCDRTTPASLARCEAIRGVFGDRVRLHHQTLPFLGGAMREAFALARGSHSLMISSDLETDPSIAHLMIERGREHPGAVITASRWIAGGGFDGYGRVRVWLNWVFQRVTSIMYRRGLTDATFGYRLFPTSLVRDLRWTGLKHELLLETILKPVRLGVDVIEVPMHWTPRRDGESQNSVATQARYIRTLLVTRFLRRASLLATPSDVKETPG
ncbi:MAG TPA: glycosyltransferase [Acidimicrobiia bacterium]|nr:glycosyltransferase [Acidimicrobiia bacterium]